MVIRARPIWLIGQAASNGVICGCAVALLTAPVASAGATFVIALLTFLLGAAIAVLSIRRRRLVIDDVGVSAIRNAYELHARWEDIEAFEQGRFAVVVPVTLLRLNDGTIVGKRGRTVSQRRLAKIRKAGTDRFIQISVYVENPRIGPFGDLLRQHRPDLALRT